MLYKKETRCLPVRLYILSSLIIRNPYHVRFYIIRVMIHEPACSPVNGQTVDCILEVNELLKMRENMVKIYAQRTGQPSWQIEKDMQRDFYMSAEEAKDYGIIDVIAASG